MASKLIEPLYDGASLLSLPRLFSWLFWWQIIESLLLILFRGCTGLDNFGSILFGTVIGLALFGFGLISIQLAKGVRSAKLAFLDFSPDHPIIFFSLILRLFLFRFYRLSSISDMTNAIFAFDGSFG